MVRGYCCSLGSDGEEEDAKTARREKQRKAQHNIIEEILQTEADYVKDLDIVVRGYLNPMRTGAIQTDLFTDRNITNIFSNIEHIYTSQVPGTSSFFPR